MKKKLSILIVIKNEEKQIEECIKLLNFADEIVIILDQCTDNSEKICRKFTSKIYKGSWDLEGERRNYGIQKCSYEWILEIDADERVSKKLGEEVMSLINTNQYSYYLIPVDNYIGKSLVKYGWGAYFGKSAYPGLFVKGSKLWGNQRVHPKISFVGNKGSFLKNSVTHFYCKDISDMFFKLDKYSTARSYDLFDLDEQETLLKNFRRIFSRFWKCFILRKGYKEKYYGFLIGLIAGLYPLISFLKFQLLKRK